MRRGVQRLNLALGVLVVAALAVSGVQLRPNLPAASAPPALRAPEPEPTTSTPSHANPPPGNLEVAPAFHDAFGGTAVGPFPASAPLTVAVALAETNDSSLAGLVSAVYAPGTPEYRNFWSTARLAASYGPSAATVSAAVAYFDGSGLSVTVSPDHLLLFVSGPSSDVAAAFHTSFEEYRSPDGRTFFTHATPATLPASISWAGVYGLGNVTSLVPDSETTPVGEAPITPSASCSSNDPFLLVPCQIWQAYNMTSLISSGTNGSGFRVAVVDPYSSEEGESQLESDLTSFVAESGLKLGTVNYVYPVPGPANLNQSTNTGWYLEDALDLEWARASAPGATIDMTFAPNSGVGLYEAVDWLVSHQAADVISLSWGEPDVGVFNAFSTPCSVACNASSDGSYGILSPVLADAAAEGIGVFAASGDCGAADGTSGVATNFPASDPDVTGVGGTVLTTSPNGSYLSEVAWSGNATGGRSPGCSNQGGSGGGYSPFPRPAWQSGLPTGESKRGVPDVALDAGTPVSVILHGGEEGVLGTSVGTPIWAGVAAIADQYAGRSLGFLDPALYQAAAGTNYSLDFHDIHSGSNGYPAGVGWDAVTGLGTPKVTALVTDLTHSVPPPASDLSAFVYASPRLGDAPLTVSFRIKVTGGTGTYPLEGVSFGNSNASFAAGGETTYTYLHPGVYGAQAYVADSSDDYSLSPPVVIVVGGGGPLTVNLTASAQSPGVAVPVQFSVNVTGGVAPYLYNYSFGDGSFLDASAAPRVEHAFGAAGSYCAEVVVSDSASPVDGGASARVSVGVGGDPRAFCGNETRPLTVGTGGSPEPGTRDAPAEFFYSFGASGGEDVSGFSPSFFLSSNDPYIAACQCEIFRSAGTYRLTETAVDGQNEAANVSVNVTVTPPLVASFTASPQYGYAPLTVDFRVNASGGNGTNTALTNWSFGDGNFTSGEAVSETYRSPGVYVAVGHLADQGYGNASEAFVIGVGPRIDMGPPPLFLEATVSPAVDVSGGSTVSFAARLLSSQGAPVPALFHWSLTGPFEGDGSYVPTFNSTVQSIGAPVSGDNQLRVSLVATEVADDIPVFSDFFLNPFIAVEGGVYTPNVDALNLIASVPAAGSVLSLGAPLNFSGSVSGPGVAPIVWSFGDSNSTVGSVGNHTYAAGGLYSMTATATDAWGDRAVDPFGVGVAGTVGLSATVSPSAGPSPLEVRYAAAMSGGVGPPYWYRWTFGNGDTSSAANGTENYTLAGTYAVHLVVNDADGFTASENWTLTASSPPSPFPGIVLLLAASALGGVMAIVVAARRERESNLPR